MATAITFPTLQSINDAISLAYELGQLSVADSIYKSISFVSKSTGDAEVYPMFAGTAGLREWVGDRVVHQLGLETFRLPNKTFEETISVRREDIEDDRLGLLTPVAQQLGIDSEIYPDLLIAQLLKNGHNSTIFDGQNFFDVAHPNYSDTGGPATVANYQAGSSTSWYLIDTSKVWRPFIWQERRPFKIIPKFSMTDPSVFWDNEFVWGVDGRGAAGYGLWHLASRSDAPMNQANLLAAWETMGQLRRQDGAPMGVGAPRGLKLIVPRALYATARAYCENPFDPMVTTNLTPNAFQGIATAVQNDWLN